MLMQIAAWLIGIPFVVVTFAYTLIFSAILAAKIRQSHVGFEQRHAIYPGSRELRSAASGRMDMR